MPLRFLVCAVSYVRPIYDQKTRRDGMMNAELREALLWWHRVLTLGICEVHPCFRVPPPPLVVSLALSTRCTRGRRFSVNQYTCSLTPVAILHT